MFLGVDGIEGFPRYLPWLTLRVSHIYHYLNSSPFSHKDFGGFEQHHSGARVATVEAHVRKSGGPLRAGKCFIILQLQMKH